MGFPAVIDSTILTNWAECRRRTRWEYMEGWRGLVPSIHLHAGGAFAYALEMARKSFFFEGESGAEARAVGLHHLDVYYRSVPTFVEQPELAGNKTLDKMLAAFNYYLDHYPLQTEELVPIEGMGVEVSFAIPLRHLHPETNEPLVVGGRFDVLARRKSQPDMIWGLDDKTCSQMGAQWRNQWATRLQFMLYTWAMRQQGFDKMMGVMVRGIAIKKDSFDVGEVPVSVPHHLIVDVEKLIDRRVQEMLAAHAGEGFPRVWASPCTSYGGCPYRDVCLSSYPRGYLETNFKQQPLWNPLASDPSKASTP